MPSVERKLAAILSADVVGYSRLMAEDEAETIRTLGAYRTEITHLVEHHRGRVADFTGDNFLAEFPTALDAVECAVEVQSVLKARNASLPENRRMEFRIGVHLGDVAVEGERLYGDGVNIAARLEGLAEAGGVCISGTVHDLIQNKLEVGFEDLGEQTVKNIPKPVRVYRLSERATDTPRPSRAINTWAVSGAAVVVIGLGLWLYLRGGTETIPGPPLTSIAVLPFDDLSPGGDQAWLADGMAEDLIESLSRIDELRVIARTSAFGQRGEDIASIGERLQVGSLVEGSLRRSGDQLRVTAQLIRVADSSHLWSGTYARQLDDVFAIQREIAREVAEAIRTELGVSETKSWLIESRYATPDVRAWELVKKAVDRQGTWTEQGFRDEIDLTRQALEIDPAYAQAHAEHGWGYFFLWMWHDPRDENFAKARASAERALELDPTNGSAHNILAWLSLRNCDWAAAQARFARALKDTPTHGPLREGYGSALLITGRVEEARTHFEAAVRLDPEMGVFRDRMGSIHLLTGNLRAAIDEYQRALDLAWPETRERLAYAHHLNGDDARAAEMILQAAPSPGAAAAWARTYAERGYVGLQAALLEHQIAESGSPCTNDPGHAAFGLAIIGEPDRMFDCMEEGVRLKRPPFLIKVWPAFDPYRDDPRFTALLRRMNLAD